jgi:hypothetical protein
VQIDITLRKPVDAESVTQFDQGANDVETGEWQNFMPWGRVFKALFFHLARYAFRAPLPSSVPSSFSQPHFRVSNQKSYAPRILCPA